MNDEIVAAGSYYSDQFEFTNQELRQHVKLANTEIENVKDKVNELVVIVHDDNELWSLKKICAYIAGKNDDLEEYGFSARTIHRYLSEENKQLVDKRQQRKRKGTIVQNNVTEQSGDTCHPNVLEQSSISKEEELQDLPEPTGGEEDATEEPEVIYDPKLLDEKIEQIAKLEVEKQELQDTLKTIKKEKVESSMSNKSSTIEYSIELSDQDLIDIKNNGGIEPLLITSHQDGKTITAKLDRMRLHQKKKR